MLSCTLTFDEILAGDVTCVSDGDTIHIIDDNQKYKIRFYGIDTPEKNQDFGLEPRSLFAKGEETKK